jgi:hypothetical protein
MTYTYKLARRLAISRNLAMLNMLALLAACAGDTTAPEAVAVPSTPAAPEAPMGFRVLPGNITVEINQRVRFRGELRTTRGQVSAPSMHWKSNGGVIDSIGRFSASTPGTYRVIGHDRTRSHVQRQRPDTSVVTVVPKQPKLLGIRVTPRAPSLEVGERRSFTAVGQLRDGTTAPIGVRWDATGGSIDAAGVYQAGSAAGVFRVIATNMKGTLADTVRVTVSLPTPETMPLARVVLRPATVTLATLATHQFAAFGRNTVGDSIEIDVTFRATGGTITPTGLYTAGQTAGTYRVIAASSALADTSVVTLAQSSGGGTPIPDPIPGPTPAPGGTGIPMGIFGLLSYGAEPTAYTMAVDGYSAGNILTRIAEARRMKIRLFLNMTGGSHSNYMTNGVFDMAKWRAKMDSYNTAAIRSGVAAAVAEGIIVGNSVMDEPANTSTTNTWGPAGTMTKARVDDMCRYVKNIFPSLPTGVLHDHRIFEPEKGYQTCEFIVSQYRLSKGDVTDFRDGGLAFAARHRISIIFSLNIIHGGTPGTDCDKWGDDPRGVLCPMSATQLRDWGIKLGSAGCALMMWKYERAYIDRPEIQGSLRDIAGALGRMPRKPCTRT